MLVKLISDINKLSVDKNTNLEIECRFSIDDRKKEKIYSKRYNHYDTIKIAKYIISKAINDKNIECSIEQSINFIRKDSAIKKILFNNGIQNKTYQHYQKNKLIHPVIFQSDNNYPSWSLMISEETKIEPFDIKETSLIRIKLRFTIILEKWNVDITLVKNVDNLSNSQELKVSKDAMLFNIDIDNFIEKAPWNITDTIEFELEYNKDHALFIYDDLKFANEFFESYIDDLYSGDAVNKDYQKILFDIGKKIKLDKLSKYKGKIDLKVIGNQPIELNKNIYLTDLQNNITNYYITDKVDGVRCIIYIDNGIHILTDKVEKIKSDIKECYYLIVKNTMISIIFLM